jgi:hypothetical protein
MFEALGMRLKIVLKIETYSYEGESPPIACILLP